MLISLSDTTDHARLGTQMPRPQQLPGHRHLPRSINLGRSKGPLGSAPIRREARALNRFELDLKGALEKPRPLRRSDPSRSTRLTPAWSSALVRRDVPPAARQLPRPA